MAENDSKRLPRSWQYLGQRYAADAIAQLILRLAQETPSQVPQPLSFGGQLLCTLLDCLLGLEAADTWMCLFCANVFGKQIISYGDRLVAGEQPPAMFLMLGDRRYLQLRRSAQERGDCFDCQTGTWRDTLPPVVELVSYNLAGIALDLLSKTSMGPGRTISED